MEVVILPDPGKIAEIAADVIVRLLNRKPDAVIGLATGSSPLAVYDELVRRTAAGEVSFAQAKAFMLDEYVGIPDAHPERYRNVIRRDIESRVDFAPGAVQGPEGNAGDLAQACLDYEHAIAEAGGVDLQILGIGSNGHIAFNEPGSSLSSRTRMKVLSAQTIADNSRFFEADISQVPRYCLTQGLGTILDARHLLLIATGDGKAEAVRGTVEGGVSSMCPGSVIQLHPRATVFLDDGSASLLKLADYYRHTYATKPDWQEL